MITIRLDDVLLEKLHRLTDDVELIGDDGKVVARIRVDPRDEDGGSREPQVSTEELLRRAKAPGRWYTTAEVLEHLKSLENQ
mgnify:CR=1 FL=1